MFLMLVLGKLMHTGNARSITDGILAVMMFFPTSPHPQPADMNWSVVMYGFVTVILLVFYFTRAKYFYDGPVKTVLQQWTTEASDNVETAVSVGHLDRAKSRLRIFNSTRVL